MYLIGLTGGIASGKSTVSNYLESLGAAVIDADKIAREIVRPGCPAWQDIAAYFGEEILLADQELNRVKLGERIFNDAQAKKKLEEFTHPRIQEEFNNRIEQNKKMGTAVAVLDIPLLYEVGWESLANENWVIFVDRKIQLDRLMRRNRLNLQEAQLRLDSQWNLAEKASRADVVIQNGGDRESTRRQVLKEYNRVNNIERG